LYPRSVLTRRCQSESGSVIRAMGIATIRMDTAITQTDITDLIDTPVIIQALRTIGATGIEFTGTIAITITTIATNFKWRLS
jgi:hypothetical protein